MTKKEIRLVLFLEDLMRRRQRSVRQFASDLGVSRSTISRWLSGKYFPNRRSCLILAEYGNVALEEVLYIAGHLPRLAKVAPLELPGFREYARQKYPTELDEDFITMIEDLIKRQSERGYGREDS